VVGLPYAGLVEERLGDSVGNIQDISGLHTGWAVVYQGRNQAVADL
jgi:hypothetical protein